MIRMSSFQNMSLANKQTLPPSFLVSMTVASFSQNKIVHFKNM